MPSIKAQNINHPNLRENLNEEKYTLIRDAILEVLPTDDSMTFTDLEAGVHAHLSKDEFPTKLFPKEGSVRWYTKSVQLDLEARGLIERIAKTSPMRLRKIAQDS